MEDVLGVEDARRKLGDLVRDASSTKKAIVITRRAKEKAVLLGYEEYKRLRDLADEASVARVSDSLLEIHTAMKDAGIPASVVAEAIRDVRSR